ncbi:MAG: ribosome-associated translation inhibitor RaiA [Chloroflexota bacterium]
MEMEILGENLKVTEALNSYARKKLERLDRYLPNIADVRVELRREHTKRGEDLSVAQITVRHKRGAILRSQESVAGEIEGALNLAVDNMYRQIQRFKGKRDPKKHGRFAATLEELGAAEAMPNIQLDGDEDEEFAAESLIARRKNVAVTTMTEEEAVEQMELLGHSFFLFFNPESGGINVVYRRRAEGYGVLNPIVE